MRKSIIAENVKENFVIANDVPAPYVVKIGDDDRNGEHYAVVKTTEARGISAKVTRSLALHSAGPKICSTVNAITKMAKQVGVHEITTLSGQRLKPNMDYWTKQIPGCRIYFSGKEDQEMLEAAQTLLQTAIQTTVKEAKQQEYYREKNKIDRNSPEVRKYAADARKQKLEDLYAKYGKETVKRVTYKQVGGDDGYQYAVFIDGLAMVHGLTLSEVPYYQRQAYDIINKKKP